MSTPSRTPITWLIALSLGCRPDAGTQQPGTLSKPSAQLVIRQPFPDAARVEALAAQPSAPPQPPLAIRSIDTWQLSAPLPNTTGPRAAAGPDNLALAGVLAGDPTKQVSEPMACFARQVAGFMLRHGARPSADLEGWIGGRCGVGHARPFVLLANEGDIRAKLFDASRDQAAIVAAAGAISGPLDLGVATVDDGKKKLAVIAGVLRRVTLDRVEMVPKNGRVIVTGEATKPLGWVRGHATWGPQGFSTCTPVASSRVGNKAFALSCPVDPNDGGANIEIVAAPEGRLVGDLVLSVWASPDGSLGDTWTARSMDVPLAGDERDAAAWLTAINAIRERAKLVPWTHARSQSVLVGGLLPHLVAQPSPTADPNLRDEVALGMLAGWKVEGTIRSGDLVLSLVPRDVPFERSVGAAMSSATFRAEVLSPVSDTAAVAVLDIPEANLADVLVVSYALFTARDYLAQEQQFLDQLDVDRVSRGLPPVERVGGPRDRKRLSEAATRVRQGKSEPMDELAGLVDHFAEATGQSVRGVVFTTLTLDGFRPAFEGPLATATKVVVAAKIADWRPPGSAWGQHVIYVIYAVPGER